MSFFKKLAGLFSAPAASQDNWAYYIYVRCNRCGEKIKARVDLRNDLSIEYGERESDVTYRCRKVLLGEKCFQQIEVVMIFDANRNLVEQTVHGGKALTKEEFEAGESAPTSA